jgi:hypothetical protein
VLVKKSHVFFRIENLFVLKPRNGGGAIHVGGPLMEFFAITLEILHGYCYYWPNIGWITLQGGYDLSKKAQFNC